MGDSVKLSESIELFRESADQYTYFRLWGNVNSTAAALEIKPILLSANSNLLLDLSGVSSLTSTGVGLLFELYDKLSASGHKLILVSPSYRVDEILELTGFGNLFPRAESRESAAGMLS